MKRRKFLQLHMGRLALTFLLLCLIIYTCYHAMGSSSGSLLTTPARAISDAQIIGGEAWLFRDEVLLTSPREGLVNTVAVSGEKVGKNDVLTEVWTGAATEQLEREQLKLDALNRTVRTLEASLPPEGETVTLAESYRAAAKQTLSSIQAAVRSGNLSLLSEMEQELLVTLNRYGALTGEAEALQEALRQARADRDAMLTGERSVLTNTVSSAYYYALSEVDGYEEQFTHQALVNLTAASFRELKGGGDPNDGYFNGDHSNGGDTIGEDSGGEGFVVGKLCYGYSWHLAVEFSDGGELFEEGVSYTVRFPENNGMELELICERLLEEEGAETVVILRSDVTPAAFRYLRSQTVEITVGSMDGIYIPEQALVMRDGTSGVYVFEDSTVRFRRIRVLYTGDGYLIAAAEDDSPENGIAYLALNDLMVTSGKNLYDGKVYQ